MHKNIAMILIDIKSCYYYYPEFIQSCNSFEAVVPFLAVQVDKEYASLHNSDILTILAPSILEDDIHGCEQIQNS